MKTKILWIILVVLLLISIGTNVAVAKSSINPPQITPVLSQPSSNGFSNLTIRVYYLQAEYEAGKHKIVTTWIPNLGAFAPEDYNRPIINEPYSILEIDIKYNRALVVELASNLIRLPNGDLKDAFYIDGTGSLRRDDGSLVTINLNPQIEAFKASQLYGMTQAQLEAYIDANVTNLTQAKDYLKKLSAVVLYILKNTDMEK